MITIHTSLSSNTSILMYKMMNMLVVKHYEQSVESPFNFTSSHSFFGVQNGA